MVVWFFFILMSPMYAYSGIARSYGNLELSVAQSTTDWWSMFHHDLTHTGYSTSKAPSTNQILWNFTTGGGVDSSPAVVDGKVYVSGREFYALDASTGAQIWNFTTVSGFYSYSSPAVVDGKVYVGSGFALYCLNASNGAYIWNYTTGADVDSSPAVSSGTVYVGSDDHNVYALDASTGALVWSYTTGSAVESSPAVVDGEVYVGSDNVYALDAYAGALLWNYTKCGYVHSSPAVADGSVYVGSIDGHVYALDASNGYQIWNFTVDDPTWNPVVSSPAIAGSRVYVGSGEGYFYALDASSGALLWSYKTGGGLGDPAVADGKVYVGSGDGKLYALYASTGALVWSYEGQLISPPAVADGVVYVGSWWDHNVYAFGAPTCILGDVLEAGLLSIPPDNASYVKALNLETNVIYLSRGKNSPALPWDQDGEYLVMCPPGTYRMWAWSPCYIPSTKDNVEHARQQAENTTGVNFRLAPSFARLNFIVINNEGTPIQGAEVSLTEIPNGFSVSSSTDSQGTTWLELEGTSAPSEADYTLRISQGTQTAGTSIHVAIPLCNNITDPGMNVLVQTNQIRWDSSVPSASPRIEVTLGKGSTASSGTLLSTEITLNTSTPSKTYSYSLRGGGKISLNIGVSGDPANLYVLDSNGTQVFNQTGINTDPKYEWTVPYDDVFSFVIETTGTESIVAITIEASISPPSTDYLLFIIIAVVVAVGILVALVLIRSRKRSKQPPPPPPPPMQN